MNDDAIRRLVRQKMIDAGIVVEDGINICFFVDGREYVILMTAVDVTQWQKESE